MPNRSLLISRVGPQSLHHHWLAPADERTFDVLLSAYDSTVEVPAGEGIFFEHRPGRKVAGYGALLHEHRDMLRRYDYIALFDDDLRIDAASINTMFAIARQYDLKIAQPALTPDSFFSYAALLRHPGFLLRYVTYIEMMCPLFRTDILERIAPLFDMGYESGIDLIWCNLVAETPLDFAVIDAVTVAHTRRVGIGKAANGFTSGKRYEDDIAGILEKFDAQWLPCAPYGAIRSDGSFTNRRSSLTRAALGLAGAVPTQSPMKMRARNYAVYIKHLLTAPARNMALSFPHGL